jgi:UDP-N-acetylmuramoyl-L-alanyl-D-glutamate--2,6-diaminopimelate ligase
VGVFYYMRLSQLLVDFPYKYQLDYHLKTGDPEIAGVVADSRQVHPGDLFVALSGGTADGHDFIPAAIRQGAAAVVGTRPLTGLARPYVLVDDSRKALPYLAAAFYGLPARKLTMIGVTGTDGKTTTTNMIYQILLAAGIKAGMISTINAVIGDELLDTGFHVTTPDAPDIQRYLAQMLAAGLSHVVLEVTSHGLAQYRVDACEFDVAVVTNVTHEHLDYHGSYQAYLATKARLFTSLEKTLPKPQGNPRMAILNRDDSSFAYLVRETKVPTLGYGFHEAADVRPIEIKHSIDGISFTVTGKDRQIPLYCPLLGDFNIINCLAAVSATVYALDIPSESAKAGIASLQLVPGRMERISLGQDFIAIVDFAHTPNALKNALQAVRQLTPGRLIAVFGAAGLRDRQKRAMMASTSVELADMTILTAEDPRTERLEDILDEMASGALENGGIENQNFWCVPDRAEAIRFAVSLARPGDVVITCGKGHEQSMCFGVLEYPWDDRTAMRAALAEHLGLPGPQMPYLPTQD